MKKFELPDYPVMYKMNMVQESVNKKPISDFLFFSVLSGTGRMAVNGIGYELYKDCSFLINRFAKIRFETSEAMQIVIIRISEDSVKDFLLHHKPADDICCDGAEVEKVPSHLLIHGLVSGIEAGIDNDYRATEPLLYLKILECINVIVQTRPELCLWLAQKNSRIKVNLRDFMEVHYRDNQPLEQLAIASGRSLSTFRRDFTNEFGMLPGKWLLLRRLKEAFRLITQEHKQPSSFIYELGFESFSHFSRSFKAEYGVSPSTLL
nr:AraC family transcriptional regulator [Prevotella sp.]